MKAVLVYFNQKQIISTVKEGVEFINSLKFRGNSHPLTCSPHCENNLRQIIEEGDFARNRQLTTTGIGSTRIYVYEPLADTIEEHDRLVAEKQEIEKAEAKTRADAAHQQWMKEALEPMRGWYVVTITGIAMKNTGNDGEVTQTHRVLADSKMDAYHMAKSAMEKNPPHNVMFWSCFESSRQALVEYVGVWTDYAEMEYSN